MSLRYLSTRAVERLAPRYISTRPALPLPPTVSISPAYIPASPTVTQYASASAIRSAHPPRWRDTRRPNHLTSANQHGFVVLRTPQLSASFLNRSAVVANATNKFDARRVDPGLPAKFRLGDGSLGDSSSLRSLVPRVATAPQCSSAYRTHRTTRDHQCPLTTVRFTCLLRLLTPVSSAATVTSVISWRPQVSASQELGPDWKLPRVTQHSGPIATAA